MKVEVIEGPVCCILSLRSV